MWGLCEHSKPCFTFFFFWIVSPISFVPSLLNFEATSNSFSWELGRHTHTHTSQFWSFPKAVRLLHSHHTFLQSAPCTLLLLERGRSLPIFAVFKLTWSPFQMSLFWNSSILRSISLLGWFPIFFHIDVNNIQPFQLKACLVFDTLSPSYVRSL